MTTTNVQYMACPVCDGNGWVPGNFWPDDHGTCWECGGTGRVVDLSPAPVEFCADDRTPEELNAAGAVLVARLEKLLGISPAVPDATGVTE